MTKKDLFQGAGALPEDIVGTIARDALALAIQREEVLNPILFRTIISPLEKEWVNNKSYTINSCIDQGADVNARDSVNDTLLHKAAFHRKSEAIKTLLEHGASETAQNSTSNTPLLTALSRGAHYMGQSSYYSPLLTDKTLSIPNHEGNYPLHIAASHGGEDLEKILTFRATLDPVNNNDLNHPNMNGETPLEIAAYRGNMDNVTLLEQHGANPSCLDEQKYKEVCLKRATELPHPLDREATQKVISHFQSRDPEQTRFSQKHAERSPSASARFT